MRIVYLLWLSGTIPTLAADLATIDRRIAKEPAYAGKPQYCLLVFGAETKHRVWLVHDAGVLYVDRDGDGDLTEAGERVAAKKSVSRDVAAAYEFDVGELRVGNKTHKGLEVTVTPLKTLTDNPGLLALPQISAAIRDNPEALTGRLTIDVECEALTGGGIGGRVSTMVSLFDNEGVLQFAARPAEAPIIHLDGPLQITLWGSKPTWVGGRTDDLVLCVGSPGRGPGTFAMVKYEGVIPADKHPKIEATFVPKEPGMKPVKEVFELQERC